AHSSFTIYMLAFFLFHVPATTTIYTLSLHDALPIYNLSRSGGVAVFISNSHNLTVRTISLSFTSSDCLFLKMYANNICLNLLARSEEHTSELQSRENLVCRLLLEKKKKHHDIIHHIV